MMIINLNLLLQVVMKGVKDSGDIAITNDDNNKKY